MVVQLHNNSFGEVIDGDPEKGMCKYIVCADEFGRIFEIIEGDLYSLEYSLLSYLLLQRGFSVEVIDEFDAFLY